MKKVISIIKHCSCLLFPLAIVVLYVHLNNHVDCYIWEKVFFYLDNLDSNNLEILANVLSSFIGILLGILIFYLNFFDFFITPRKIEQCQKIPYRNIYESYIVVGLFIYAFSLASYFFGNTVLSSILFIAGLPNIFVTICYAIKLIKHLF